ncbi:MAG TPA: Gx transporter family protein [Clostridia bacterium]|nr:Gx transporter family protein [Clostridia bacterium]
MPSHNKSKLIRLTTMALLVSMAAVLSYFERFIPVITVPGVKLGLASIFTLAALVLLSWKEALLILIARIFLVSFFAGSPLSLFYSLSGGLLSLFAMYLALKLVPKHISIIGVSLLGAFFHNTGQCIVLAFIIGSWEVALGYYPILVLAALLTGGLTGYISSYFLQHIQSMPLGPGLS